MGTENLRILKFSLLSRSTRTWVALNAASHNSATNVELRYYTKPLCIVHCSRSHSRDGAGVFGELAGENLRHGGGGQQLPGGPESVYHGLQGGLRAGLHGASLDHGSFVCAHQGERATVTFDHPTDPVDPSRSVSYAAKTKGWVYCR